MMFFGRQPGVATTDDATKLFWYLRVSRSTQKAGSTPLLTLFYEEQDGKRKERRLGVHSKVQRCDTVFS